MSLDLSKSHASPRPGEGPEPAGLEAAPRAATRVLSDFDELVGEVADFETEYVRFGSGSVRARLQRVQLDRLVLLRCQGDPLPHYAVRASLPMRSLFFLDAAGTGSAWHGEPADEGTLLSYQPGGELVGHARGRFEWLGVLLAPGVLERQALALGFDPGEETRGPVLAPAPASMRELRGAVRQVFEIADARALAFETAALRRSLEESLLTASVHATQRSDAGRTAAGISHERAVRRAFEVLEARAHDPIYLAELCGAAGVSERTLRNAFQQLYGVSPIRYLHLYRMEQVRNALRAADPRRAHVVEIAQQHGFSNPGRFALEFRRLFGESPSETLRRPAALEPAAPPGER